MATIGLDKLFYAPITEDENGDETYGSPVMLAKAMTADLSVELNEATLFADDGAAEIVKEFKSGTLSLGVNDSGVASAEALTGAWVDANGGLISAGEKRRGPGGSGLPGEKIKRHLPVFLDLSRKIRDSGNQPRHQGRQHYIQHPHH